MPTLSWNGCRWELQCTKEYSAEAKAAGFHHDWQRRCWWTGLLSIAKKFESCADPKAREKFLKDSTLVAKSRALTSDFKLHPPEGLEYMPFQGAGVEFSLSRSNTLNADQMGTGKTIQAIGMIDHEESIKKVLVIPPASLKLNWRNELVKWLTRRMTGDIATGSYLPETDIVIANYDIIKRLRPKINDRKWDLVICDEAHMMKNPASMRSQAVLGNEERGGDAKMPIDAGAWLFLTGTPILNRPIELWPMLRKADPEGLGASHWAFARRYCMNAEDEYGYDFTGSRNLDELQNRLRTSIMIRRLKKDVLGDMPPKRRQIIVIPEDKAKKEVQAEVNFYDKYQQQIHEALIVTEQFQGEGNEQSYQLAASKLKQAHRIMFEEMSKLRHDTAIAKIPYSIEYLEQCLENEEKVFHFAHHREVIDAVAKHFGSICVQHHGGMTLEQKQASVDRFDQDPSCRLFDGGITTAIGYSATKAVLGVGSELDWRPAIVSQVEDRLHRIGQQIQIPVTIQHLVFDNSLDSRMVKRILEKQEMIDQALDNE